eukprot:3455953-Amphidinium_carterae.1
MGYVDDYCGGYENLALHGGDLEAAYESQIPGGFDFEDLLDPFEYTGLGMGFGDSDMDIDGLEGSESDWYDESEESEESCADDDESGETKHKQELKSNITTLHLRAGEYGYLESNSVASFLRHCRASVPGYAGRVGKRRWSVEAASVSEL